MYKITDYKKFIEFYQSISASKNLPVKFYDYKRLSPDFTEIIRHLTNYNNDCLINNKLCVNRTPFNFPVTLTYGLSNYLFEPINLLSENAIIGNKDNFITPALHFHYPADTGYLNTSSNGFFIGDFDLNYCSYTDNFNDLIGNYDSSTVYLNYQRCPNKKPIYYIGYQRTSGTIFLRMYAYNSISNQYNLVNTSNANSLGVKLYSNSFAGGWIPTAHYSFLAGDSHQIWVGFHSSYTGGTISWYPIALIENIGLNYKLLIHKEYTCPNPLGSGVTYTVSNTLNFFTFTLTP